MLDPDKDAGGQIGADALDHGEHYRAVTHIEPEPTSHQLAIGVAGERVVGIGAEIRLKVVCHCIDVFPVGANGAGLRASCRRLSRQS